MWQRFSNSPCIASSTLYCIIKPTKTSGAASYVVKVQSVYSVVSHLSHGLWHSWSSVTHYILTEEDTLLHYPHHVKKMSQWHFQCLSLKSLLFYPISSIIHQASAMLGPLMYKYWESIATHWSGEFKKYLNPLRQFILGKHNVEVWGQFERVDESGHKKWDVMSLLMCSNHDKCSIVLLCRKCW